MDDRRESKPDRSKEDEGAFALYITDAGFLACVIMLPVFLSAGHYPDALLTFVGGALCAAYGIWKGQPWPGVALLRHWRKYL